MGKCKYLVLIIQYFLLLNSIKKIIIFTLILSQMAQKKELGFRSLDTWVAKNWVYVYILALSPSEYACSSRLN